MNYDWTQKSFSTNILSPKESKKDLLWNVIEPGDPYDIRKYYLHLYRSMIGKLPGGENKFMGDKL